MKKIAKITILILFPVLISVIFLLRNCIAEITKLFPECFFYNKTGYYCPACGNTRSVMKLLWFDFLEAAKYNMTPIVLMIFLIMFYAEFLLNTCGINLKIVPRNIFLWFGLLTAMIIYYLLRNFIRFF